MKTKKKPRAQLEHRRPVLLFLGLMAASAFTLTAFQWRVPHTIEHLSGEGYAPIPLEDELIPVHIPRPELPTPTETRDNPDVIKLVNQLTIPTVPTTEPMPKLDKPVITKTIALPVEKFKEEKVWASSEVMPMFPGGDSALFAYMGNNLRYPAQARNAGIQGTVYVRFVVSKHGTIEQVSVLRGLEGGCTEETLRVLEAMPQWEPGVQNGKKVSVWYTLPVRFTLR